MRLTILCLLGFSAAALKSPRPRLAVAPARALHVRGGFSAPASIAQAYLRALSTAPVATNCATAAVLSMSSDRVAQSLGPSAGRWDAERTAWMAVWGAVVSGLALGRWFAFLAWLFPRAATDVSQLAGKVFVNQLVLSPGINGAFFAWVIFTRDAPTCRMPPAKREALARKLRDDLPPTMLRSCCFWIVVQTANFRCVPPSWTVVFSNVAFVVWNSYLSLVGHRRSRLQVARSSR